MKYENCPMDHLPIKLNLTFASGIESIKLTGSVTISEKINGNMDFTLDASRCDYSMKSCEKYQSLKVPDMCSVFNNPLPILSSALKSISPPIKCPIVPAIYTIKDTFLDLKMFNLVPIDGVVCCMMNFEIRY